MFARPAYFPLRSSSDSEATLKSPGAPKELSSWLVHRKIRAVVAAGLFIPLLCLLLFQWPGTGGVREKIGIHGLSEHVESAPVAVAVAAPPAEERISCNCSMVESGDDGESKKEEGGVDWKEFAYVQYVTNLSYLCNSLMIFEALRRFETKAGLLMMYPHTWTVPPPSSVADDNPFEQKLLAKARDEYKVNLVPIEVKTFENKDDPTWQDSYTKLLAFNQTQYRRLISLDSDATVLDHMDELFLLPSTPIAMPRAYWMDKFTLSSQLIVLEPSSATWTRVSAAIDNHQGHDYDMDILNKLFSTSALVLPHRKYDLLTGEFKWHDKHANYLGQEGEEWDPRVVLGEAKYLHFSDWPMPKPWLEPLPGMVEKFQPECRGAGEKEGGEKREEGDCRDREVWLEVRRDFTERRERICGKRYDRKAQQLPQRRSVNDGMGPRSKYEPVFE